MIPSRIIFKQSPTSLLSDSHQPTLTQFSLEYWSCHPKPYDKPQWSQLGASAVQGSVQQQKASLRLRGKINTYKFPRWVSRTIGSQDLRKIYQPKVSAIHAESSNIIYTFCYTWLCWTGGKNTIFWSTELITKRSNEPSTLRGLKTTQQKPTNQQTQF